MVQVPGGGQYARPKQRLDGVWSPSYSWRGGFGYDVLDGPARQVAWAVSGVSFVLSRPPRTWRRWFVFVLLLNPGSPCHLPELPNRVVTVPSLTDSASSFPSSDDHVVVCLSRPVCPPGSQSSPSHPQVSPAGVRRRATGHVEVLEVAGPLGAVADGLAAPTRYRSLPRAGHPSSAKPSGRDVLGADGQARRSLTLACTPKSRKGRTPPGSLRGLPQQTHSEEIL